MKNICARFVRVDHVLNCLIALAITFCSGLALAADRYNMVNVHPNSDLGSYFYVQEAGTLPKLGYTVGTSTLYDYRLLEIKWKPLAGGTQTRNGIDHLVSQYFYGAFGLTDRISFSLDFPLYYAYQYGFATPTTNSSGWTYFKAGDLWLNGKLNLFDIAKHPVGLALIASLSTPTGKHDNFLGDEGVTGEGRLVFEAKPADRLHLALNIAFQTREKVNINDISFRDVLKFSLGANYKVAKNISLIGEASTQTPTTNFFTERRSSPTEVRAGAKWNPKDSGLSIGGGGSAGLVRGAGAPWVAGFLNLSYIGRIAKKPVKEVKAPRFAALDAAPGCERISADDGSGRFLFKCSTHFAFDSAKTGDLSAIADIARAIEDTEGPVEIELRGWADPTGKASYNRKLSLKRAEFLRQQLKFLLGEQSNRVTIRVLGIGEDAVSTPADARRSDSLLR